MFDIRLVTIGTWSAFSVSPICCFPHCLHSITYTTFNVLQLTVAFTLYDLPVVKLLNVSTVSFGSTVFNEFDDTEKYPCMMVGMV